MRRGRSAIATLLALACPALATAQAMPPNTPLERQAPEPPLIAPAADQVGGHFRLHASAGWAVPWGRLDSATRLSSVAGPGPEFGAEASLGISRTVALAAWGRVLLHAAPDGCTDCSARSLAVGPMLRYHLVQGLRFDPWIAAGPGWRSLATSSEAGNRTYGGLDLMHLTLGGDWFATRNLLLGPSAELTVGTNVDRPDGAGSAGLYWAIAGGIRVGFDAPGQ